jgi:hypothetical protein
VSIAVRRDGQGFSDSLSVDFADPEQDLYGLVRVELRPGLGRAVAGGLALERDENVELSRVQVQLEAPHDWSSVEVDGVRIADDGERARVVVDGGSTGLELEATRLGGSALEPGAELPGLVERARQAFSARITGECRRDGASRRIRCFGRIVRTAAEVDWERIELLRSLTAVLEDGSLLALAAARPAGAAGHGAETVDALLLDSDGSVARFEEPLLSTQYDSRDRQRRAGVELPVAEEPAPVRGAGARVCGASLDLDGVRLEAAFLDWSLDGVTGTARYDLLRGA